MQMGISFRLTPCPSLHGSRLLKKENPHAHRKKVPYNLIAHKAKAAPPTI